MERFEALNKESIYTIRELIENDDMIFDIYKLKEFISTEGVYGFIYILEDKPIGLAYCCRLLRPDGIKEMYLHSIDVLPDYQNKGYGTKFLKSIINFAEENGFSNLFLSSSKSLGNACHMYEKIGGKRECDDEIIYSYSLKDKYE